MEKEENVKKTGTTKKVVFGMLCGAVLGAVVYANRDRIIATTVKLGKNACEKIKSAFSKANEGGEEVADEVVNNN